jgi:hypothetical protein
MRCPMDYHSASHATVPEFVDAWLRANPAQSEVRPEFASYDLLGLDSERADDQRLVFWFDN